MFRTGLLALGLAAVAVLCPSTTFGMERADMDRVLTLARTSPNSPEFRAALAKAFPDADIKTGVAYNSNGPDFVWAVEYATTPVIVLDDKPAGPMRRITGSNLWFYVSQLKVGLGHRFHYVVDGKDFGGSFDMPAYTPDSYAKPGVPQGKIS